MVSQDRRSAEFPVVSRLRAETGELHRRIEARFDAVAELSDPARRPLTIHRYAAFYDSAHASLAADLDAVEGLEYASRYRAWLSVRHVGSAPQAAPAVPQPADRWEALGFFYVVEGSTLGGRVILRELQTKGIRTQELSVLDPYGQASGSMWRALMTVLEREGARGSAYLQSMCRGATQGFREAERVLCGDPG